MNRRDYFTKIHTHLQEDNIYKPLTHISTSKITNDARNLIDYMHSGHIIGKATIEFLLPPKNTRAPLFYELPKFTSRNPLSALLFQDVMVKLAISLPTLPILSNLFLTSFRHTLKTQNIFENYWKSSTPPIHCPCNHCWHHVLTYKHPVRRPSRLDLLHRKIRAPSTRKLSTFQYSAGHTRFHPQTWHLQIQGHACTPNSRYLCLN